MKCEICGNEIKESEKKNHRPKTYCSKECKNYSNFKSALEKSLMLIKPNKEATKIIRGDMFRLANMLSNANVTNNKKGDVK